MSLTRRFPNTRPLRRPRRILLTLHRRESHGDQMRDICQAMRMLAARGDVEILFPVHLSPAVRNVVLPVLRGVEGSPTVRTRGLLRTRPSDGYKSSCAHRFRRHTGGGSEFGEACLGPSAPQPSVRKGSTPAWHNSSGRTPRPYSAPPRALLDDINLTDGWRAPRTRTATAERARVSSPP